MNKTVESIICDACQKELIQHTSMPAKYGLVLSSQDFNRNKSGFEYSVGVSPPIDHTHHFCNKVCLRAWLDV